MSESANKPMAVTQSFDALKQFIQSRSWHWQPGKPILHGEQIVVGDGTHQAIVNFYSKRGNLVSGGSNSPLKAQLDAWINGEPTLAPAPVEPQSTIATRTRLDALKAYLKEQGWNWGRGQIFLMGSRLSFRMLG